MYTVIRRYTGASELADALVQRQQEVKDLISGVPGFKAYHALRTDWGDVATITICDDRTGTDESIRRAAGWVRSNLSRVEMRPPEIIEGEIILSF
jgi:heme-degrading monooxygenase HmoA